MKVWGRRIISLLAALMLFTGILHAFRGFRTREQYDRNWSIESLVLGAIEIGLAVLLFIAPFERGRLIYILLSIWALFGGLVLISQALYIRRQSRQQERGEEALDQFDR